MALLTGSTERWGRKPLFLLAFAVLPLRGLLFACASNPALVIAIQLLDGVGAGLQGPLFAVMVADLTRGTGRYNVAMGAATMVQGIGGALSPTLALVGWSWLAIERFGDILPWRWPRARTSA